MFRNQEQNSLQLGRFLLAGRSIGPHNRPKTSSGTEDAMRSLVLAATALTLSLSGPGASATEFPTRPLEIVVPFPPGGNTDLLARLLADGLQKDLKQPVTVVNKPGAGANIGAAYVANSKPDGYTMLISA